MRRVLALIISVQSLCSASCATTPQPAQSISLRFAGAVHDGFDELLFFELSNNSSGPVWFTGFALNDPLYEIHRKTGNGFELVDTAMSATGSKPHALGPGQRTTFVLTRWFHESGHFWLEIGVSSLSHPEEQLVRSNTFSLGPAVDSLPEPDAPATGSSR